MPKEFIRKPVMIFSAAMERKLRLKDEEKGEDGWITSCTVTDLLEGLKEEIKELEISMEDCDTNGVMEEAVHIANYAMMIYDRLRGRCNKA